MATPDIGTTIGDGYRRGFERLAATAPSALVPAVIVGVIAGVVAQVQVELVPDAGEVVAAVFSGESIDKLSRADLATMNALSAISTAVQVLIGLAGLAVFGGALHRARHAESTIDASAPHAVDDPSDVPAPGAIMGAIATAAGSLMPKLGLLVALAVAGPLVSIVSNVLGALITIAAFIALIYFGIRWTYAPIIAGAGEGAGDAAFQRSEEAVEGNFWPTLGIMLVVGLAVFVPVAIVAAIVGTILPTAFLGAFGSTVISMLGMLTLYACALESAWAQVEAGDPAGPGDTSQSDADFLAGPGPVDPIDPDDAPRA